MRAANDDQDDEDAVYGDGSMTGEPDRRAK